MSFGEELKTTAIVGTAQKELNLPHFDDKLGETLTKIDHADREKFLLSTAAVFSIWQTAGKTLQKDTENPPKIAENEKKEVLSGRLKQMFETILQTTEKNNLLPEFLNLMAKHERLVPPELLPLILSTENLSSVISKSDIRHLLLPVIGNRGKWLGKQRENWRWTLFGEANEELWETGKLNERIFALEFIRFKNADKAREMLQTVWKTESAKERQKLLEVLQINLSEKDEEFLDDAFHNDKNAEVKRTIFDLLANLPKSRLSDEFTEFIRPMISVKRKLLVKKEIEIEFPEDWEEKTANLKAVAKQIFQDTRYFGEKAMALAVGLSLIDPKIWESSLNLKSSEIAELAHKNEFARALLAGFGIASIRYENAEWFGEILKFNSKFSFAMSPLYALKIRTFSFIPEQKLLLIIFLDSNNGLTDWLFENLDFQSDEIKRMFEKSYSLPTNFAFFDSKTSWDKLAVILPFSLIDKWIDELEKMKSKNYFSEYLKKAFDGVIETLNYRKEYILEFEK